MQLEQGTWGITANSSPEVLSINHADPSGAFYGFIIGTDSATDLVAGWLQGNTITFMRAMFSDFNHNQIYTGTVTEDGTHISGTFVESHVPARQSDINPDTYQFEATRQIVTNGNNS
ncbi:MAG: hypothetical protein M3Y76_01805 [Chloroflexota bacterium]|nr:hypothetical protein [Chloroflexota bacterium]